jgi:ribosomal protein S18 acetylase RimI-like enzyme
MRDLLGDGAADALCAEHRGGADSMSIRLASCSDAEAISAILWDAFAEFEPLYTPAGFSATTPSKEQIAARFAEGPIWVADLGGELVGTVAAVPRGPELYIRSMAVRPAARGHGIGTQLLNTIEAFAIAHRNRRLVLNTTPFLLAAIQLYERHGFRRTGEEPDLFGTPLATMAKELSVR